ncbi:unnamed protein product [Adineta steineri]|uniref:Uncharacterized protein n=1 Tax=Adineta steineri TaxID=433720 RepID=A0A814USJ0_9BILA|nr:unnamed protein product [Adineta steineri]CAF1313675.1 unnamed protein product [Adineta steineri]CAF1335773.1 unnamed protein product [Adineta steineri]CAF3508431.1 unnamed protein product [Adineta steineri]CAF3693563.1 unnamed protein product [Adineta steineri]
MATSTGVRKPHSSYKKFCNKCRSDTSPDPSRLSIRINDTNTYENTPSPSSVASTSTIEQSLKDRHRILSSTLKNDLSHMPNKRRSRFERLFHHTQLVNKQYMITMTNILYRMQREIHKLKRRTHRVEHSVVKNTKPAQPVIRIPRLTKDQLSTIYIYDDEEEEEEEKVLEENETIPDINNNNDDNTIEHIKSKSTKALKRLKNKHKTTTKDSLPLPKKFGPSIWVNNRQKPIDPTKYCSICNHEYSRRSNFLVHIRNIHKGKLPPLVDEQDQSLLEMNEENHEKSDHEDSNDPQDNIIRDQSVVIFDDDTEPLQTLNKQWNIDQDEQITKRSSKRSKAKCNICNKRYRTDYLAKHKRLAHPEHQILAALNEINNNSGQKKSISNKSNDEFSLSKENSTLTDEPSLRNVITPATITIAEMDTDDVPILFRTDPNRPIVIAVTCLEAYQIEFVDKFLEKYPSACQTTSIDSRTTHLITNDEHNPLRSPLSMKLIEAIAHHCYCVSYRWIQDSVKCDRLMDESPYEIEGDDTDVHPHGGPHRSRLISKRHSLFQNICFMIKCTENSDIQMTNERLEDLITTCGGQIITCVTQRLLDKYQIIVLCDMLYVSERRNNYDQCRSLGIHFVSSDWVLESILEYRRKPFSLFEEVPL